VAARAAPRRVAHVRRRADRLSSPPETVAPRLSARPGGSPSPSAPRPRRRPCGGRGRRG
jgi:hypothetical protein